MRGDVRLDGDREAAPFHVEEDGTIPAVPGKSWLELDAFRTNAQIENGGICQPQPAR